MECEERKTSKDWSVLLPALVSRRSKVQEELCNIEKRVYDMETTYLQDPNQCGNVLKGFERFLSASKITTFLKRSRKLQPEDRLFSLSSVTSPAAEELGVGQDDGRSNLGLGRSKGAQNCMQMGRKPKRGRPASREAKRTRHTTNRRDWQRLSTGVCWWFGNCIDRRDWQRLESSYPTTTTSSSHSSDGPSRSGNSSSK